MQEIFIDEEFRSILPALDKETYRLLEENIMQNGCRDAIILWEGILIDGYNRYKICTEHDIPFNTVEKTFGSREEVLIWIVSNQISRRNLQPIQLSYYRGLHYHADKRLFRNESGRNQFSEDLRHNDVKPHTATRLAAQYRVSARTIDRDAKVAEAINSIGQASPEAKSKILSGEVKLDKKALAGLVSAQKEDIEAVATEIERGIYKKKKPEAPVSSDTGDYSGSLYAGAGPLEHAIGGVADGLHSALRTYSGNSDMAELKAALRSYIDTLEGLYMSL